jgi:hypothetical protein
LHAKFQCHYSLQVCLYFLFHHHLQFGKVLKITFTNYMFCYKCYKSYITRLVIFKVVQILHYCWYMFY